MPAYASFLKLQGKLDVPGRLHRFRDEKSANLSGTVDTVKTGVSRELPPQDPDWFYLRCASIARQVYIRKTVGVGRLCKMYGSAQNRGVRPSKHVDASKSVVRRALQALEKLGVIETNEETGGRSVTPSGQRDLDRMYLLAPKVSPSDMYARYGPGCARGGREHRQRLSTSPRSQRQTWLDWPMEETMASIVSAAKNSLAGQCISLLLQSSIRT